MGAGDKDKPFKWVPEVGPVRPWCSYCQMANAVLSPYQSGMYIAEHSEHVQVEHRGVKKVADEVVKLLKNGKRALHPDRWKSHPLNPKVPDAAALQWIFISAVGNFSFWSETPETQCTVTWRGKKYDGMWAWCAAINRALAQGIPITTAYYLKNLTLEQLQAVLQTDTGVEMPLMKERLEVLREAGRVLLEKFKGSFLAVLVEAAGSAQKLLKLIVENFPSFRDNAAYREKTCAIYKRVQMVVADVWSCCGGQGHGAFWDIDILTGLVDDRVPQVLAFFGALKYSPALLNDLENGVVFENEDQKEVELRGCSIWAVELIIKEVRQCMLVGSATPDETLRVNSAILDAYFWNYRKQHEKEVDTIPVHRVRSIYY